MPVSKELFGIQGSNFKIRLEYTKGYVIVHLPEVIDFKPSTFKEMKVLLDNWTEFFKCQGLGGLWAAVPMNNKVINRLALRLGFKSMGIAGDTHVMFIGD